eukprot:CAMPEP_0185284942 /NCGR_PEP_ID=MMETSP1363-20130426/1409_1 /TAXON_ID=38817 /ORGANISM="Gephyrocapsa oceanica, Strain RCC1303" /LENGTH=52 /DNA_ID=CAMNT_0027880685 /DNA_START=209 /DNA_END=367 /DNA_ORIENTATION=+
MPRTAASSPGITVADPSLKTNGSLMARPDVLAAASCVLMNFFPLRLRQRPEY